MGVSLGSLPGFTWQTKRQLRRELADLHVTLDAQIRYGKRQAALVDRFMADAHEAQRERDRWAQAAEDARAENVRLNDRLTRLAENGDEAGKHWQRTIADLTRQLEQMTAERDALVAVGELPLYWQCREFSTCTKIRSDADHWRSDQAERLHPSHVPTSIIDENGKAVAEDGDAA